MYSVCVCFFIFNFIRLSAVYEASLCTFVLRSDKLTELEKAFSRYFLSADRTKKRSEEYLVLILAVERKL